MSDVYIGFLVTYENMGLCLYILPITHLLHSFTKFHSKPRHRGLGEKRTTFFRKDARSSPAANSKIAIALIEKLIYELET